MSRYEHYDLDSFRPTSSARTSMSRSTYDDVTRTTDGHSTAQSREPTPHTGRKPNKETRRHRARQERAQTQHPTNLSWRLDPDESLSDYTIVVLSSDGIGKENNGGANSSDSDSLDRDSLDEGKVKYYHVHKPQLGVGPRRSEYFARLFRSMRQNRGMDSVDNIEHVSRIELKASAADAFPAMLDFLYSPPGTPVNATTENAVALRHLATCFGIRELFTDVTSFIQKDLNVNTALVYLHEAGTYNHEKLLTATVKLCAMHFAGVKLSRLVQLPPSLFQRIVTSPHFKSDSETLSSRVASYCRCRPGSIDRSFLISVTGEDLMPVVARDEAIFLLTVLVDVGLTPSSHRKTGGEQREGNGEQQREDHDTYTDLSLYKRCLVAATESVVFVLHQAHPLSTPEARGRDRSELRRRHVDTDYDSLPADVKIDLLERALVSAPLVDPKSPKSSKAEKYGKEKFERLKSSYEKKVEAYRSKLAEKTAEVRQYAEEMSKFVRVPNQYRNPPLMSEYTYKAEPEYDRYGESLFGFDAPTALPRVGRQSSDGWILKEDRWTPDGRKDSRNWAMFYYKAN